MFDHLRRAHPEYYDELRDQAKTVAEGWLLLYCFMFIHTMFFTTVKDALKRAADIADGLDTTNDTDTYPTQDKEQQMAVDSVHVSLTYAVFCFFWLVHITNW